MRILGIESSCDDTAVALLDSTDQGHFIVSEKTAAQIDIHAKYGGVVPEIAGRMHAEKIVPLIEAVLENQPDPDVIAVTAGPGLITGLLVGVEAAKALSLSKNIPLVTVNHIQGHIHSVEVSENRTPHIKNFPALCLVVSGGHTELILMSSHEKYEILGSTKDDAAGECFDKVAKLLNLPYPGGPKVSKLAESGDAKAIDFPRPMLDRDNFEFSFAGLKTSALYWLRDNKLSATKVTAISLPAGISGVQKPDPTLEDFCASFEQAIIDVLVGKTLKAVEKIHPKTFILAGGVAANKKLRESLQKAISESSPSTTFLIPPIKYCMDNAAMIAAAGYHKAKKNQYTNWNEVQVNPNWKVANQ